MDAVVVVASTGTVALMGAFARRNRKDGWVKTRKTVIDMLRQAKRDLLTLPEQTQPAPSFMYAGLPIDPSDFATQLGRLHKSLRRAGEAVPEQANEAAKGKLAIS